MASLLQESFLLPVHADVVLPLHSLYQQHVTPALEQLLSALLDSSAAKANKQAQLADAKQLVSRCGYRALQHIFGNVTMHSNCRLWLQYADFTSRHDHGSMGRSELCRCYEAAVVGAEAEHAARRRLITRVLQDIHACLEVRQLTHRAQKRLSFPEAGAVGRQA